MNPLRKIRDAYRRCLQRLVRLYLFNRPGTVALLHFSGLIAALPVHILVSPDAATYTQVLTLLSASAWLLCRAAVLAVLPNAQDQR